MRRRLVVSGFLSLLIHLVVVVIAVEKWSTPELEPSSKETIVYVSPEPAEGLGIATASVKSSRSQKQSRAPRMSAQKIFSLSDQQVWSGTQSGSGVSGTVTSGEGRAEAVSGDGRVLIAVMGEPRLMPLLSRLARLLHESLSFTRELCDLHSSGFVEARLFVNPEGTFDGDSLQASSQDKYLLVYLVQRLDELFGREPHKELAHQETVKPKFRIQVRFISGPNVRYATNPLPQLSRENIEIERRRQTALNVEAGPLGLGLTTLHRALAGGVELKFDLESLISKSHRKTHGWTGMKDTEQKAHALKVTYDRLWAHYRARGWIR